MKFQDLQDIFQTPTLAPWEHDYYVATFEEPKTPQQFLDYAYENIQGLSGIWYEVLGNSVYFVVAKDTLIPNEFAFVLIKATDVPEQPTLDEGNQ